jgi:hypothetical protein
MSQYLSTGSFRRVRRWSWLLLAPAGVLVLGHVGAPALSRATPRPLAPECEIRDAAASAALAPLIADRDRAIEAQLGDALFRLRRARRNCRHEWVGLARFDYDALLDGRYGRQW